MAETEHDARPARPARVDRHRVAAHPSAHEAPDAAAPAPAVPPPPAAPDRVPAPVAPAVPRRPASHPAPVGPAVEDKTSRAVRRPALLSDHCIGCGASTRGRAGMVTELVEVGPVRALRVVACSACPERRRRGTGL